MKKKTNQEFLNQVYELYGDEYIPKEEYKGARTPIAVYHTKCNEVFNITPDNLLRGKGCRKCSYKERASNRKKTNNDFLKEVKEQVEDEYTFIEEYKGNKTKIKVRHNKCGNEYLVSPEKFLLGRRCPKCSKSHGEQFIANWLTENNFKFEQEVRFEDCRYKLPLPFDFKVYTNNSYILIEFDGRQHFEDTGWENFDDQILKDGIKDKYCKGNNINLIRIPYTYYDRPGRNNNRLRKRLEEILVNTEKVQRLSQAWE